VSRLRGALAVAPALLPGACVLLLAFQAGGFYPSSWAPLAAVGAVALAVRVATVEHPFAGFSAWSAVAVAALALFGAWILLSAQWSDAPGRAVVEFGRLLAYLVVFALCASLVPREHRLSWAIRGVAVAIAAICVAALVTRLRPDLWEATGIAANRLDFPITYWNGLGMLAGAGLVLALHLTASDREPWWVRVLAAAVPPVAACTIYFTLSRGGIIATAVGVAAYLLLGFSRATPGALLALVPPCIVALSHAYDADVLVSVEYASPVGMAEGREMVRVLAIAVAAAVALRAVALLVDRLLAGAPGPDRLPLPARFGLVVAGLAAAVVVALAAGAPAWANDQVDAFLDASPAPPTSRDVRDRLTVFNNNGRVDHWNISLDDWREARWQGSGAGTFQNSWNEHRPLPAQVLDAHSLYIETLGELGLVGFALLLIALIALLAGLASRLRGPERTAAAAVLAASLTWAVHAGVDWDWELVAVSIWVFGLAGIALAPRAPATRRPMPRLLRLIVALGCLALALSPAALWRSQDKLETALTAFRAGDCPRTIDAALDSLRAVGARAEAWELIAYCDVRLGQEKLAVGAAEAAVRRDPGDWEYHYALAIVRGATRQDPRPAAAEALRLNPMQPEAQDAVKAFRTKSRAQWERRARRLKLYVR
jgi:O-antigen ligase